VQREILVKKKRWERERQRDKKHNSRTILMKTQKNYNFLGEKAFCSFKQYEKIQQEA
jgi:hypothetical protein